MNPGQPLPDTDFISRAARYGKKFREYDPEYGITSTAFKLRKRDDGKLSAEWVECEHVPEKERIPECAILRQARYLRYRPQKLTILSVSEIRRICFDGRCLDVLFVL